MDNSDIFYNFNLKQLEEPSTYMHFDFNSIKELKAKVESKLGTNILWFGPLIQQYYTIEGMAHHPPTLAKTPSFGPIKKNKVVHGMLDRGVYFFSGSCGEIGAWSLEWLGMGLEART